MNANKPFLIFNLGKSKYDYHELFQYLNTATIVKEHLHCNTIKDLYSELLLGIIYDAEMVLFDNDLSVQELNELQQQLPTKEGKNITNHILANTHNFQQLLAESKATITLFTSGTTGQPKKVTHSVQHFFNTARQGDKYESDVWAMAYNPTHMAGIQVFFQAIINQNTVVDIFKLSRNEVIELLQKFKVTHISATPTFYRLLLPADFQINTIQKVTVGGEKSNEWLYDKLKEIFPKAKITNIYASTEAGSLFYSKGEIFTVPETIAQHVKIEDDLLFLSASILGKMDTQQEAWYSTGDVVEVISISPLSFKFISRKNEMINVGGNKVNPDEVETALMSIEGVKNAYVFGKANSVLGNMLYAEIELHQPLEINDIRKKLSETLQDFKVPRMIKIVEHIAVTRTGKIKRHT